ncbi:hypothetical protein [Paenibacillus cremeus]|uniref:Uncharacterized protein n=1 Tax=Paenibacillus cremeus TaxID=2163881 RepID=A0A559KHA6_9BACL|nr:hypothetical protein [Paenibacillus cremeus]TVY11517.1 hypothetical protein FPZ49_02110 [Paenibacillus cremeus]
MLYGIAVVVIAAVLFLIVYNVKAAKSTPPKTASAPAKTAQSKAPSQAPPEKPATENQAPHGARTEEKAGTHMVSSTSVSPIQAEPESEPAMPKAPIREFSMPDRPLPPRKPQASSRNWEQSDDEYRKALRSFSGMGGSSDASNGEPRDKAGPLTKDNDFREGLRSLTNQDNQEERETSK